MTTWIRPSTWKNGSWTSGNECAEGIGRLGDKFLEFQLFLSQHGLKCQRKPKDGCSDSVSTDRLAATGCVTGASHTFFWTSLSPSGQIGPDYEDPFWYKDSILFQWDLNSRHIMNTTCYYLPDCAKIIHCLAPSLQQPSVKAVLYQLQFYTQGDGGAENLKDFPKAAQLGSGRTRIPRVAGCRGWSLAAPRGPGGSV